MKSRLLASGVAALAIASVAVPAAMSGSASAKGTAPTISACAPVPATIGQTVTIKGTNLAKAKSVTVGGKPVAKLGRDTAKKIKFTVPAGTNTKKAGVNVIVKTANGSANHTCTFQAAP